MQLYYRLKIAEAPNPSLKKLQRLLTLLRPPYTLRSKKTHPNILKGTPNPDQPRVCSYGRQVTNLTPELVVGNQLSICWPTELHIVQWISLTLGQGGVLGQAGQVWMISIDI